MTTPRGLTPEEAAAWRRVTATVTPLHRARVARKDVEPAEPTVAATVPSVPPGKRASPAPPPRRMEPPLPPPRSLERHGLDGSWERRLSRAEVAPEVTIDLHGLNLDQAHARLLGAIGQATAMGVRVVLLVTGKPRPRDENGMEDHAARGQRRGAIRAKLLDWLAVSSYAGQIAAVRPAHPRHGGAGAVYVVLKRSRP